MLPSDPQLLQLSNETRSLATECIEALEAGGQANPQSQAQINENCQKMIQWVYEQTKHWMNQGKLVGLIGGDHSTPLGYLRALGEKYPHFGILHIDAHADLRQAYEGFTYSHASIFYNAIKEVPSIQTLVQVGIRDYCEEEILFAEENDTKIKIFFDHEIKRRSYQGENFHQICQSILSYLPKQVYISFDIDALDPKLCPNTGTPVAGGFELQEVFYLCRQLLDAGIQIIGFDVNEVGSASEWDGNVGARAVYKMANLMGASRRQVL
jgi:agmatinase